VKSADGHPLILALPAQVVLVFWLIAWRERRRIDGPSFMQRNGVVVGSFLIVAVGLWSVFMIVLPQLFMVEMAFRPKLPPRQMGGPTDIYTLDNFRYFLFGSTTRFDEWNAVHLRAFWQTILASVVITFGNLLLCYPLAFYLAKVAAPARVRMLLLLLITPYWVNEVLRAFAFRFLFSTSGVVNKVLLGTGVIGEPVDFLAACRT